MESWFPAYYNEKLHLKCKISNINQKMKSLYSIYEQRERN